MHDSQSSPEIRRQLRQLRRTISCAEREQWDGEIANHLIRSPWLRRSSRVASYLAQDGEVSLHGLHLSLFSSVNKRLYLPVLKPGTRLGFAPFEMQTPLLANRFGIPEPHSQERLPARFLSLVLVPLVGFDEQGHRLGMGAGYYDRSFAFARDPQAHKRPWLIGVGYELQRCDALPVQPWDVPLDGVVTEKGLRMGLRNRSGAGEE